MPDPEPSSTTSRIEPFELTKSKLLIGEGVDEVVVFGELLKHLQIDDVQVKDYGGKDNLPAFLDALKLLPGFSVLTSLGVTRDGDADPSGALASLRDHLNRRGFVTPLSSGSVEPGTPTVGILILPDAVKPGMLEDLFLAALQVDSLTECIDQYFECVIASKGISPSQLSKARIHTWLAAQDPPDMRLRFAAKKGLFDWDDTAFALLRDFLTAL